MQNRYNHLDRTSEKVLQFCEEQGIVFLPWGPLQTAGDPAVDAVARESGATPSQVALAWLLRRSPVILPIPGTSSVGHLEENMAAVDVELDDRQMKALSAEG